MAGLLLAAVALLGAPAGGTLIVDSAEYGVEVVVDRRPVGQVPLDPLPLPVGFHLVEMLRDGRSMWQQLVFVGPARTVTVRPVLPPRARPQVLGDLRRAPPPTPVAEPRWRLSGGVVVDGAVVDRRADLQWSQRWRLDADDVPVAGLSAGVEVSSSADLAGGSSTLLDAVDRRAGAGLVLDEARIDWRGPLRLTAGRLFDRAPGERAFVLDGARIQGGLGPVDVVVRGGRRAGVLGVAPDSPWLGGAMVALDARWIRFGVESLYHDGWITGAHARGAWAGVRLAADARARGTDPTAAGIRLSGPGGVFLRGAWRSTRGDAFDAFEFVDPRLRDPSRVFVAAGLRLRPGPWRVDASAAAAPMPAADDRPRGGWADLGVDRALGRHRLGLDLHGQWLDWASIPTWATYSGVISARFRARIDLQQVCLVGNGGLERVDRPDATSRWSPVGALEMRWAVASSLELFGRAAVEGTRAMRLAADGVVWHGRVGVRLR